MDLQRRIEIVLAGQHERAGLAPPLHDLTTLRSLARRARDYSMAPGRDPDPRWIAVALGFRLLPRAPRGMCGEGFARGVIAFRPDVDASMQGLRVFHGLAHAILWDEADDNNEADAWILSALLPPHPSAHAPSWLTAAARDVGSLESWAV